MTTDQNFDLASEPVIVATKIDSCQCGSEWFTHWDRINGQSAPILRSEYVPEEHQFAHCSSCNRPLP